MLKEANQVTREPARAGGLHSKKTKRKMKRYTAEELARDMEILGCQKYPVGSEAILRVLALEAVVSGWPWVMIKAYHLGVIHGKRMARRKYI